MNNNTSLFEKQLPSMEELIEFVSREFPLKLNEEQFHRHALATLIIKFMFCFEDKKDFWRRDITGNEFPWDDYKATLTKFLQDKRLWGNKILNNNLKQEHMCVLFYIAALRYRAFPLPVLQVKYDEDNESQNPHTDLFLYDKNEEEKPAYAVQPRILTKSDMELTGELKHSSYRSSEYLGKDLLNSQDVRIEGITLGKSFCFAMNNQDGKTRNIVVHINPNETKWDECGVYEEIVTSQTLNSAPVHPQNQMGPNGNNNNQNFINPHPMQNHPIQNSQSPPASQGQASQDVNLRQSCSRTQAKESKVFRAKMNTKQSYLIIPHNVQDPGPPFTPFSAKQLKPSSSFCKEKTQKIANLPNYPVKMSQNSQDWKFFGGEDALMDREERQVSHPILRRNGFKN